MSRYIDADEIIYFGFDNPDCDNLFEFAPRELIEKMPTADVVEVVRCKDCADWIPQCGNNGSHYCATMDSFMKPTDYCSYGERREA